jgi:hypothetical protein
MGTGWAKRYCQSGCGLFAGSEIMTKGIYSSYLFHNGINSVFSFSLMLGGWNLTISHLAAGGPSSRSDSVGI